MTNASADAPPVNQSKWLSARILFAAALVATGLFLVYGAVLFTTSSKLIQLELAAGFVITLAGIAIYAYGGKNAEKSPVAGLASE